MSKNAWLCSRRLRKVLAEGPRNRCELRQFRRIRAGPYPVSGRRARFVAAAGNRGLKGLATRPIYNDLSLTGAATIIVHGGRVSLVVLTIENAKERRMTLQWFRKVIFPSGGMRI